MLAIYCCIVILKWIIIINKLVDRGCKALTLSWRVLCFDCDERELWWCTLARRMDIFVMAFQVSEYACCVVLKQHLHLTDSTNGYIPVSNSPVVTAWGAKLLPQYTFQSSVRNNTRAPGCHFLYFTTTCLATTVWEVAFQDSCSGSHNLFNIFISLCNISIHCTTCIAGVLQYCYISIYCHSSS